MGGDKAMKLNTAQVIFTAIFVGVMIFLKETFFPDYGVAYSALIGGGSALIGGLIGKAVIKDK